MKIASTPFDSFVEQHYQGVYQIVADLVLDPLAAARVTERVFRHVRDLMSRADNLAIARRTLLKIVVLESAADSIRIATARQLREPISSSCGMRVAWCQSVAERHE